MDKRTRLDRRPELVDLFHPQGHLRTQRRRRPHQGRPRGDRSGVLYGDVPDGDDPRRAKPAILTDVDVKNGQKTGSFLDQQANHQPRSSPTPRTKTVLDCFSHTGGFGLHAAAKAGAKHVDLRRSVRRPPATGSRANCRTQPAFPTFPIVKDDVFDLLRKKRARNSRPTTSSSSIRRPSRRTPTI
ncbi:MAG: class I SAM-dependent rRNA methyltransferase [Bacillus subtilis]|nr:class I SAM-dependent rRNA methyltransferase [Bacillus subtilis]